MTRVYVLSGLIGFAGVALLLGHLPSLRTQSLTNRLRPHVAGAQARQRSIDGVTFAEVLTPLALRLGELGARLFGIRDALEVRLRRVHAKDNATTFRTRQLGRSSAALVLTAVGLSLTSPSPIVAMIVLLVAPTLVAFQMDRKLSALALDVQRQTELELPIVAEQLAMMIESGLSLGNALARFQDRTEGVIAREFVEILRSVRNGATYDEAIAEWANVSNVPSVDRFVAVLRLHQQASNLGRLIAEEAVTSRAESHRRLLQSVETKSQQVWIPVTVAALVPGTLFLAIPFFSALRFFAG
jgi:tight adherence protein C